MIMCVSLNIIMCENSIETILIRDTRLYLEGISDQYKHGRINRTIFDRTLPHKLGRTVTENRAPKHVRFCIGVLR